MIVMPGPVPGIHDFLEQSLQLADGRGKPGHDAMPRETYLPCPPSSKHET